MAAAVRKRACSRRDLVEHYVYLAEHASGETADRFLSNAEESGELSRHPEMGAHVPLRHPRLAGMRKWRVSGFERYLIFYLPRQDGVSIVRVLHAALVEPSRNRISTELIPDSASSSGTRRAILAGNRRRRDYGVARKRRGELCNRSSSLSLLMFGEKGFQQGFRPAKAGLFQFANGFGEIDQAALGCDVEQSQSAGDPEAFSLGYSKTLALIDQQYVGMERFRQRESGCLSVIETGFQRKSCPFMYLKPLGRIGDPTLRPRRIGVHQFGSHSAG